MRLVIQQEGEQPVAFKYESKEVFVEDLCAAVHEFLKLSFDDKRCTPYINVNGLSFKAKPLHDGEDCIIPEIYTLKEWFKHSSIKPVER